MIDLQAIYIRDVAELNDIEFAMMVRIDDVDVTAVSSVTLNGVTSKFFAFDLKTLMVTLPSSFVNYHELSDPTNPGVIAAGITEVKIIRTYTGTDGAEYSVPEIIDWGESAVDPKAPYSAKRVTIDATVVRLSGNRFDQVVRVLINKRPQPFLIESSTSVLVSLPDNSQNVESVDVITTAKTVNRMTFFEYLLGDEMHHVSGIFKLVQQFIKVLMTTPGTDVFNKSIGGNLQNWVGQKIAANQIQTLIAKTILTVIQTGSQIQMQQMMANVPVKERLSDVQVLNARLDPVDPTLMQMAIKLNTFGGRTAFFSMLIGSAADAISEISGIEMEEIPEGVFDPAAYS
jgi:hypothetical protein